MNNSRHTNTRKMKKIHLIEFITLITEYKDIKLAAAWSKWFKIWLSNKINVLKGLINSSVN